MNNIFTFINDILFYKKGNCLSNVDDESQFNGYMINRWLSMYSPQIATLVNHTTNRYFSIFETKQDNYKFLVSVLPKVKTYRINYIKKDKSKPKEYKEAVTMLAKNLELSEREINYYIKSNKIDINRIDKICH